MFSYGFRRWFVYGFRRGRKRFLMVSVAERFLMVSVAASNIFVLSRHVTFAYRGKYFIAASNVFVLAASDISYRASNIVYRGK